MRKPNTDGVRGKFASPEKIRSAAARLFAERGYYNTSMQDIAERVGITKGSLYHHIPGKEAILDSLVFRAIQDLLQKSEALSGQTMPPEQKLDEMVRLTVQNMAEHQEGTSIYVSERLRLPAKLARKYGEPVRRHQELFTRAVNDFLASRPPRRPVDVPLTVLSILGMINVSALWYKRTGRLSEGQLEDEYIRLARRMLGDTRK
jgi:AcrR family transcriptional regulator